MHLIDVTSNLLFAYDGISDKSLIYVKRLKEFITTCINMANAIRENLLFELEKSFFFFNEDIDIPIVSEDQ